MQPAPAQVPFLDATGMVNIHWLDFFNSISLLLLTSVVTITAVDTGYIARADQLVLVNALAGAVTVKLPATLSKGSVFAVKKIDASANVVTIDGNGHTIDGSTVKLLAARWNARFLQTDGANVFIIGTV